MQIIEVLLLADRSSQKYQPVKINARLIMTHPQLVPYPPDSFVGSRGGLSAQHHMVALGWVEMTHTSDGGTREVARVGVGYIEPVPVVRSLFEVIHPC